MSQAGHLNISATPSVATKYTTDMGDAVPVGNELDVKAVQTDENSNNGIQTRGGVAGTGKTANDLEVQLTNRVSGKVTTENDTFTAVVAFNNIDDTQNDTYMIEYRVAATSISGAPVTSGAVFKVDAGVVIDGAATTLTLLGVDTSNNFKDAVMATTDVRVDIIGTAVVLSVKGLPAVDADVNWSAVGTYTRVSD